MKSRQKSFRIPLPSRLRVLSVAEASTETGRIDADGNSKGRDAYAFNGVHLTLNSQS